MGTETYYLSEELRKIDDTHTMLKQTSEALRQFILSDNFLIDYTAFENLLGKFQDSILAFVEAVTVMPTNILEQFKQAVSQGQTPQQATLETPSALETLTLPKALVMLVAIVGCAITVEQRLLPPIAIVAVIAASLALAFAPQLSTWVNALLTPKEEEKEEQLPSIEKLEDWLYTNIDVIRQKYRSARFLVKWQMQKAEHFPQFRELGLDKATIDREQYLRETLPHEFLSRIGKIMEACNKNAVARKQFIITAMVQARQATMVRP